MDVHLGTQLISLVLRHKNLTFQESLSIAINTRCLLALLIWHNEERTEGALHAVQQQNVKLDRIAPQYSCSSFLL